MRRPIEGLRRLARHRPPGYVDDVLSRAMEVTATHYTMSDEAWRDLAAKYAPKPIKRRLPLQKIPDWYAGEWWLDCAGVHGCGCK